MIVARRKFSPQYRDEAVKMVVETARPIAEVARELGLVEGTLGNWVNLHRIGFFELEGEAGHDLRAVS